MAQFRSANWWNGAAQRAEIDRRVRSESDNFEQHRRLETPRTGGRSHPRFDTEPPSGSARDLFGRPLDSLLLGVLLVCEGARVITLNSAAEALLARDDGLALQGRALAAAEPYESEMLRREVARALSRVDRHAGPSYAIATASRQSGKAPYLLLIAPIERGSTVGGSSEPAALIAIEDPEQPGLDFLHELHAAFEIIEGGQEVGPEIIETHGPSNVGENYREWIRSMRALAKALWGRTYSSSIS